MGTGVWIPASVEENRAGRWRTDQASLAKVISLGRRVEMTSLASCSSVSAAKAAQSGLSMIAAWEEAGQRKKVRT